MSRFNAALVAAFMVAACNSPTAPDPRIPTGTGPPDVLQVLDWTFGPAATTYRIKATWGTIYSTSRDVTQEATWESTAPSVVRIAAPGRLVYVSPGDAELRVTFRGVTQVRHLRVFPGEPPWLVMEPAYLSYS